MRKTNLGSAGNDEITRFFDKISFFFGCAVSFFCVEGNHFFTILSIWYFYGCLRGEREEAREILGNIAAVLVGFFVKTKGMYEFYGIGYFSGTSEFHIFNCDFTSSRHSEYFV